MARRIEEKVVKAMKEAKTAPEMTKSWWTQRPGFVPPAGGSSETAYWEKRKPEMISTYAHNQLTQMIDRGILDPKTRYLVILGCYIMQNHWTGLLPQMCNAKAAGATEEEIMEVAFLACYAAGKSKMVDTGVAMQSVLESATFKNTGQLKE